MTRKENSKKSIIKLLLWPFKSYLRILVVVIIIGAYQYQSIQIDILARDIRSLELKRNQLINETTSLQVQIDQLTHINRIEKLAREKFGLIAPGRKMEKLVMEPFSPEKDVPVKIQEKNLQLAGVK
jgi:cell division protein FtsL